jgi:hypothetical protein
MFSYHILFTGYGANRTIYRDQQINIRCAHNWDLNEEEAASVFFLARKEIKKHFSRFSILKVEKN